MSQVHQMLLLNLVLYVNTSTDGGGDPLIGKYFKDFGLIYEKFFDKEKENGQTIFILAL